MEKISNIKKEISSDKLKLLPGFNISILRNISIESIDIYLKYYLYKIGFNTTIRFGEYDNIIQEAIESNGGVIESPSLSWIPDEANASLTVQAKVVTEWFCPSTSNVIV